MDLNEIVQMRLRNQALIDSPFHSPEQVVAWMVAMQGQDYPGARWSVGIRLPGTTEAMVEKSIEKKVIVRSWILRGTLHLIAAEDILWLLELVAPRLIAGNQRRYRELGLDEPTLRRSNHLLAKALQKEVMLTRRELLEMLRREGISTEGQRGIYMLQRASLDRLICQGTSPTNNNAYFLSLDGFPHRRLDHAGALAELARRYIASRGPASLQDFIWWTGLPVADARAGWESIESDCLSETVEGQTYRSCNPDSSTHKSLQATFLLPTYDELLLAYKDRRAILGDRSFAQLMPGGGVIPGTVAFDGKVKGTWKRTFKKDDVVISLFPYEPFTGTEMNRVSEAAQDFGRFLGRKVTIS